MHHSSLLAGLVFSALAAASPAPAAFKPQKISWKDCNPDAAPPGFKCASLKVPMDHSKPSGKTITLGMQLLPAIDQKNRLGYLILNPGGPGTPATAAVQTIATLPGAFALNRTRERYDILALDPRGIGTSTPVKCDPELFNERVSLLPTTDADFRKLVAHNKALGASCLERTGDLLRFVDTASVARDVELVRQALGESKLNFIGASYGTFLGSSYAELFPQRVGRMVLDAAFDHSLSETSQLSDESRTYEASFSRFAAWCRGNDPCPLKGKDVGALFDKLVKQADAKAIAAPDCKASGACRSDVTGEEIRFNAQPFLAATPQWPLLGLALAQAAAGNATLLATPLAASEQDARFPALAVECLDLAHGAAGVDDLLLKQEMARFTAPRTGGATQSMQAQVGCLGWPIGMSNAPRRIKVTKAPKMLIVNSLFDPETSVVWAVGLKEQIAGAVLAVRDGDGHGSSTVPGETSEAMDAFLVTGKLPKDGTVFSS